ncbi:uncharacterized protein LOC113115480 [Carassius auratus]|uniref:Uncharacterized protein LOC113115480 n=1 Tax=Carassius auratus TaxID=7957 RepID=A0A6P6QZF6_CARAU|nr:uncharacterized protein LOC113115480 [Carassius auratus]
MADDHEESAVFKQLFIMLVKFQYQGVKKFVKLNSDSTFQDFLTEVEEDIFHELIEGSPHLCLTVRCLEENISAGLCEEFSPTRSSTPSTCTDTLSLSSTDHEETERAVHIQATMASNSFNIDSEKAKRVCKHVFLMVHILANLVICFVFKFNQDFALLFNAETSNKFLERWETAFKQKIINEAQSLTSTAEIQCLLNAACGQGSENDLDSDMSSVLLLLHLLPPAPGRKKTVDRLVHFPKM